METVVISLGGSVLAPGTIDTGFLKKFRQLVLRHSGRKFIIIVGGGKTARDYQKAAAEVSKPAPEDLDWLGIHATRLNAQLLRNVFRDIALKRVIKNPNDKIRTNERVIVAAGWKPGCSTDYDAVILARNHGARVVINITNAGFVYTRDPAKHSDAKPLRSLTWHEFRKLLGITKWSPGLNTPFDPVAAAAAEKAGISVAVMGKNLANLEKFLSRKAFTGTFIR